MSNFPLERAIGVMRRTGDKFLLWDEGSGEIAALMRLGDYERLLDGAEAPLHDMGEKEMMDKVSRDIANWRAYREADAGEEYMEMDGDDALKMIDDDDMAIDDDEDSCLRWDDKNNGAEDMPDDSVIKDAEASSAELDAAGGDVASPPYQGGEKEGVAVEGVAVAPAANNVPAPDGFANLGAEEPLDDVAEEEDRFLLEPV